MALSIVSFSSNEDITKEASEALYASKNPGAIQ
jgi:hypothetical protein